MSWLHACVVSCVQCICIVKVNRTGWTFSDIFFSVSAMLKAGDLWQYSLNIYIYVREHYFPKLCNCSKYHVVSPCCCRKIIQPQRWQEGMTPQSITLFIYRHLSLHRSLRCCHRSVLCRHPVLSITCPITPELLPGCRHTSSSRTRRG